MRVSLVNLLIIGGALAMALSLTLVGVRLARWRRDVALRRHSPPVLVMPIDDGLVAPRRPPFREVFPVRSSPTTVRRLTPDESMTVVSDIDDDVLLVSEEPVTRPASSRQTVPAGADGESRPLVEGEQVRFYRAEEGTLEFLPGRLEIVSGSDIGQEIHFMRPVGEENASVTFGRSEGPPLRHIQLLDPTVSRQHARMDFSHGHWHLSNLSQTNPVALNGSSVHVSAGPLTLQEGDRIEMGAVVFVFRER